jgi:hypothetical protein
MGQLFFKQTLLFRKIGNFSNVNMPITKFFQAVIIAINTIRFIHNGDCGNHVIKLQLRLGNLLFFSVFFFQPV